MKCIEDEIPFELPEGWAWCRGNICFKGMESQKPSGSYFKYIDIESINNKLHIVSTPKYLKVQDAPSRASRKLENGSVLFSLVRPYLENIAYIGEEYSNCIASTGFYVCNSSGVLFPEFMFILMTSEYVVDGLNQFMKGDNSPSIRREDVENWLYPIPPIQEQKLIVDKVNSVLKLVTYIQENKADLNNYIVNVKTKILDLAIRGKLVPQNPNDEPASVLLERIRAEKEELIKQGKIKRDKKESIIFRGDDNSYYQNVGAEMIDISNELPFDIPDSWCWGKLKDIVIINPRNKLDDDMKVAFITMPLIEDGYSGNHSFEIRKWKDIKSGFTHFKDGDVGIAKITPCFENRKSVVFKNLCNGYGAGTTELHVLRPYKDTILAEFLLIYAKTQRFIEDGKQTFSGAVGQQRIGKEYIETVYLPIPPLQEQQRIIKHINNLFNYLTVIEAALS